MYRAARALLIHAKRDRYPVRRPVAERYFAAARGLDVHPDGEPPEFFLGPGAVNQAATWGHETGIGTTSSTGSGGAGRGARHQTLADRTLAVLVDRIVDSGMDVAVVGGPADQAIADRGRGGTRRPQPQRGRTLRPSGHRRDTPAGQGARLRGHRRHAHGHRCGHASRCTVRPHGRSLRVLPLYSTGAWSYSSTWPAVRAAVMEGRRVRWVTTIASVLVEPEIVYAALCRSVA